MQNFCQQLQSLLILNGSKCDEWGILSIMNMLIRQKIAKVIITNLEEVINQKWENK